MKIVRSFLAALALVAVLAFAADRADAGGDLVDQTYGGCYGAGCGAYLVPAPNPIPLRRLKPVPAPGLCSGPSCANAANAYAVPPPCGQAGCGGVAMLYYPKRTYAYWKQPLYTACFPGPGNCYWRRDCWYDSFGRRFCN